MHKLDGVAEEYKNGNEIYCINDISYMCFEKDYSELIIFPGILALLPDFEFYIKNVYFLITKKTICK